MPELKLNLSEAESLKPIPDATYPGEVVAFSEVTSGPKAHYIAVTLKISEGEYEGRKFFMNLPIEGKGAGIFLDFVNKCTRNDYDADDLDELDLDTDDLIGSPIGIVTKQEEWPEGSGNMRSYVKRILKADAPAPSKGRGKK